jgi:hypothetical protein
MPNFIIIGGFLDMTLENGQTPSPYIPFSASLLAKEALSPIGSIIATIFFAYFHLKQMKSGL